jgi:SulP family sulfate permease
MCPEAEDYGIAALRQQPSVFPLPSEELPTTITPAQRKPLLHIPYLPWMRYKGYFKKNFGKDLMAGIVVSVVAIPQGLAYAVLASLPAQMGLYTSCIPPLVYGFLGTSRHLSAGPVALVSMFIPQIAVSLHMSEDSNLRVIVAAAACVVSGLLLLVVGVFRMGSLVKFISSPVLAGFTTAAAVVIGVDQLQHLVGYPFSKDSKYNWDMVNDLIANVGETNPLTLLIGGSTVLFLVGVRQVSRKHKKVKWLKVLSVTSTLIAVVCATTAAFLFSHHGYLLPLVGHVPAGLPHFLVPSAAITDLASVGSLVVACMPVTCLAFMSSWSLARNYAVKSGQTDLDANQEAVSQALHAPTFPTRSSSSISPLPLPPPPRGTRWRSAPPISWLASSSASPAPAPSAAPPSTPRTGPVPLSATSPPA